MSRTLNLIAFVVFASSLFMRSTDPVIPQIAVGLGVEPATAALLSTAFTLPYALVQPLLGALADMFSKARLMLLCLLIVAVATLACAFATSFEMLVGARMVAGLAAGGVVPIAFALVGDKFPVAQRQVAMGRLLFAIMTGNLLGATCAGVVSDLVGWRGVFFVLSGFGALVLAAAVPGFRGFAETTGRFDLSALVPNYRAIFSNPLAKICFGAVFLEAVFMYGVFPTRGDHDARCRRKPRLDRRHCHRGLRHRRRALQRVGVAPAGAARRDRDDAGRRRADGFLPVDDRRARCLAD